MSHVLAQLGLASDLLALGVVFVGALAVISASVLTNFKKTPVPALPSPAGLSYSGVLHDPFPQRSDSMSRRG